MGNMLSMPLKLKFHLVSLASNLSCFKSVEVEAEDGHLTHKNNLDNITALNALQGEKKVGHQFST